MDCIARRQAYASAGVPAEVVAQERSYGSGAMRDPASGPRPLRQIHTDGGGDRPIRGVKDRPLPASPLLGEELEEPLFPLIDVTQVALSIDEGIRRVRGFFLFEELSVPAELPGV